MLRWRLISAVGIVVPVLCILWLDHTANYHRPGIWLFPLSILLIVTSIAELHSLQHHAGRVPRSSILGICTGIVIMATAAIPVLVAGTHESFRGSWSWLGLGIMLALIFRLSIGMLRFHAPGDAMPGMAIDIFHALYVVLPLFFLWELRREWDDVRGLWALASVPWIVKWSDAGAYFCGRTWGHIPLSPQLSPKKTFEGALGGLVAAVISSLVFFELAAYLLRPGFDPRPSRIAVLIYGLVLGVAGLFGDLAESLLKRDTRQKDSAHWLPGLGGTLDVLDSLFWAAPASYLFWTVLDLTGRRP